MSTSPSSAEQHDTWLTPGAALTRFDPAGATLFAPERRADVETRHGFRAAKLNLLIMPRTLSEVFDAPRIAAMPRAAAWVAGVMNVRGTPVPVFDLGRALGAPASETQVRPLVLVLDRRDFAVGFRIDGLPIALRDLRPADASLDLPAVLQPHVTGLLTGAGELWIDFDHRALLHDLARPPAG